MKKLFLSLVLSLTCCFGINAQGTFNSEGTLEISSLAGLTPGAASNDNGWFTIALKAPDEDKLYTAYQMDIILPPGIVFDNSIDKVCDIDFDVCDIYPYTVSGKGKKSWPHTLTYEQYSETHARLLVKSDGNDAFKSNEGDIFDVYVKATSYAKPGDFQVTITGIKFVSPDETGYVYKNQVLTAGTITAGSSVPVRITSANKFSTAIFPFSCDVPDGLEVYSTDGSDGEYIHLVQEESITAFTPYILYSENGIDKTLNGTIDAANYPAGTSVSDGCITGVLDDTKVAAGYVLQNKGEGPMFYKIGSTSFTIPAGRCYANPLSAGANARALAFRFGGEEANGIQSVAVDKGSKAIFDLQGNPVLNPQSGCIYIIEGKKVLKR